MKEFKGINRMGIFLNYLMIIFFLHLKIFLNILINEFKQRRHKKVSGILLIRFKPCT
jgi:ABC-type polysaccharide transport system permease subunit